jgi:Family of unknown function (DUF6452)
MTKFKIIFISFIISFFWGCEPNDICEEGTPATPRLVIEFYDNASPSNKKEVTDLKVKAVGEDNGIVFNPAGVGEAKYQFTGSKISIPLRTSTILTSYILTLNNGSTTLINQDAITINYSKKDEFISRACGYKTVFELNTVNGITLTTDTNNWIKQIQILQPNILNETEVHVKVFL